MHGQSIHPFPGEIQLWWGKTVGGRDRPRNLFGSFDRPPNPDHMFRAGGSNGWISSGGVIADSNRDGLHHLVSDLTARIQAESEDLESVNTRIPSGYTYLLQFIAHDMVDSVTSFGIDGGKLCSNSRNARSAPLMLDTLYGSGPDQSPQAYAFKRVDHDLARLPRTHLRLGPRADAAPPGNRYCPFHDIARSKPNSMDEGCFFTEAMLADPRNDAHALLSQLTVLFQRLHNHILSLVEKDTSSISSALRELAYRRFRCARLVVTMIYRNVIEKDVLSKILDPRIYGHYVTNGNAPRDNGESIPLEFSFGAFRFGHSMVRDTYNVNSQFESQDVTMALLLGSQQRPEYLPVGSEWFVDWDRFFGEETTAVAGGPPDRNFSRMIGPRYVQDLYMGSTRVPELDETGLTHRDLLSACYAGMLSVRALCSELRARGFEREVKDFAEWQAPLDAWLPKGHHFPATNDNRRRIVEDPPLPFFVLFEAKRCGGGQHLGPVGSIIVAETILGAFRQHPLGLEERDSTLRQRIVRCGELFFDQSSASTLVAEGEGLSQIPEIESMPELLEYMGRQGCFA